VPNNIVNAALIENMLGKEIALEKWKLNLSKMPQKKIVSKKSSSLCGEIVVPGDKSISHRALILSALCIGSSKIRNILESEDVFSTASALRAMGVHIEKIGAEWQVDGVGVGGLHEPEDIINLGNSGTSARLLIGLVATSRFCATFTGDSSLRRRPMKRVTVPMELFGAKTLGRSNGRLPLTIQGAQEPVGIDYVMPIASAQVKSAILLGALNVPGITTVTERAPSRDHTERMLSGFGAQVEKNAAEDGGHTISIQGWAELQSIPEICVPGDFSSAAFPIAAALMCEGSSIVLKNIGVNATRVGLYTTLQEMGGDITIENTRIISGEDVADIRACFSPNLKGVTIPTERVPLMIDEFPILAMIAACAEGTTVIKGIAELRLKESDRISAVTKPLSECGVEVAETQDSLTIHGRGLQSIIGGIVVHPLMDHRIAMAFACLGFASKDGIIISDASVVRSSFPTFVDDMHRLGGNISIQEVL
jgi:3-phosphoshikimate 1-carboxyvinyltransferase